MIQLTFIIFFIFKTLNFIKNKNVPMCTDCIYFIKHETSNKKLSILHGRCKLFNDTDIDKNITYTFALNCRNNECGINGKYYERNNI